MLGYKLKDRKRASWIREQIKFKDLVQTTKSAKWKWAGHVQICRITDRQKKLNWLRETEGETAGSRVAKRV